MDFSIFSVTTHGEGGQPVVKRFKHLEKALEYVAMIVTTPERVALIANETCVLEE